MASPRWNTDPIWVAQNEADARAAVRDFAQKHSLSLVEVEHVVADPPRPQNISEQAWDSGNMNAAKRFAAYKTLSMKYLGAKGKDNRVPLGEPMDRALRFYHPNKYGKPYKGFQDAGACSTGTKRDHAAGPGGSNTVASTQDDTLASEPATDQAQNSKVACTQQRAADEASEQALKFM